MLDAKNILKTISRLSESIEKTSLEAQFQKLNETTNLESKQLKDHVKRLRAELEEVKTNEKDHIQKEASKNNKLINDLKDHVQSLRAELEKEKEKNTKDIDQLMQSEVLKRAELEHTIQDLRLSIEKQISEQAEIKKKLDLEAQRMEIYYKDSLSKLRNQFNNNNE